MSATQRTASPRYSLPATPSLEHLRKEAKQRLAKLRESGASVPLADAQLLLAREYGFSSWRALKAAVDITKVPAACAWPPLNRHRAAFPYTALPDGARAENIFFSVIALGILLTCMAMSSGFNIPKSGGTPALVVIDVGIMR